jgi:hypothetical protein
MITMVQDASKAKPCTHSTQTAQLNATLTYADDQSVGALGTLHWQWNTPPKRSHLGVL